MLLKHKTIQLSAFKWMFSYVSVAVPGRAIRHKNDYASILLVDHRYHKPSVIQKLPGWLRDHVRKLSSNQSAVTSMKEVC